MSMHDLAEGARASAECGPVSPTHSPPWPINHASNLAQAIVAMIREPLVVLDDDLRVVLASQAFCAHFKLDRQEVLGRPVCRLLGKGQRSLPELRSFLQAPGPQAHRDGYELEQEFSGAGRRNMVFNVCRVRNADSSTTTILAIQDVTERGAAERETRDLLQQKDFLLQEKDFLLQEKDLLLEEKDLLLQEMQHRIANSLQIIAGILLLDAGAAQTDQARHELRGAHHRVMSIATLQQQLQTSGHGEAIPIGPYLSRLCETLTSSLLGEGSSITTTVLVEQDTDTSGEAISLGLIVTELVVNAVKHAFRHGAEGHIVVAYERAEASWRLTVSDNGTGKPEGSAEPHPGTGTRIVTALAAQLEARVEVAKDGLGTTVSIIHSAASEASAAGASYARTCT
jgi:two-component sensor histidine kinase